MLSALMSGQSLPASELAYRGGISLQTASFHLRQLLADGFVRVRKSGRHRYYCLANDDVARTLESLSILTPVFRERTELKQQTKVIRQARMCYDHIAGRLGVIFLQSLRGNGYLIQMSPVSEDLVVSDSGVVFFASIGIALHSLESTRRRLAYECIDWSERTPHLAGSLGAAIGQTFQDEGWAQKHSRDRALTLTPKGKRILPKRLGINVRLLMSE